MFFIDIMLQICNNVIKKKALIYKKMQKKKANLLSIRYTYL